MRCEVIAIGNEVLCGQVVNTNAAYIAKALSTEGYWVQKQSVLPDSFAELKEGLETALATSDLVIASGGLGPTFDDITRKVAAEIFSSDFHFNEEVALDLKNRYKDKLLSLTNQATVPSKAKLLSNSVGTAPGLVFHEGNKILILLPGVPQEMVPMMKDQVVPYLRENAPPSEKIHHASVEILLLEENLVNPTLEKLIHDYPMLSFGIFPGYGNVKVCFSGSDEQKLFEAKQLFSEAFAPYIFSSPSGQIVEALQKIMVFKKKTLALAESCTGGRIASEITSLSGSSEYFLGSFVVYSNKLKEEILGVDPQIIAEYGAVSKETVAAMAKGVLNKTDADFAIAVSGIAGPLGGTPQKPVGTVYVAIAERGHPVNVGLLEMRGSRETIILATVRKSLAHLYRKLSQNITPFSP